MPQKKVSDSSNNYVPLNERMMKIYSNGGINFSVEFFPPKTKNAIVKLVETFEHFHQLGAFFIDITWHTKSIYECDLKDNLSLQVSDIALNYCWLDTVIHLTCVGMTEKKLFEILEQIKQIGIRNILALRGDLDENHICTDFKYASDLVKFIREIYGNYFTIGVAGYPNGHKESIDRQQELEYLKFKVDCGADFIVTQLFFEADVYLKFVRDCRSIGINVPIIPGILPIQGYDTLKKIAKMDVIVPKKILQDLEPIKNNDEAVRNYGIHWTVEICKKIIKENVTPILHFYTLNREHSTQSVLKELGLINSCTRPLPWKPAVNHRRRSESVRPIFWSSRPKSYVYRTNTWDEFPNGRWGNIDSPSFGMLNDYHLFFESKPKKNQLLKIWGQELKNEQDVWDIFYCYITGNKNRFGFNVEHMPWNDELRPETNLIIKELAYLNKNGILTINSQPNINGISSNDKFFGWGSENGYVYQKAYVEFFISFDKIQTLLKILVNYPLVNYQIINQKGDIFFTNCHEDEPIAVTWGVFPGKEIIQPTIVDLVSFKVWKDEAFGLWINKWASIYPEDSESYSILKNIHDNYLLVNLVDNEFPKETCLWDILGETIKCCKCDNDDDNNNINNNNLNESMVGF